MPPSWRWDIVEASLDAPASGQLRISVRMQPFAPPPGPSGITVDIGPTDPAVPTSRVIIGSNGYSFRQPGNPDLSCTPAEMADTVTSTYSVVVDANCLFNPAAVQWSPPVVNDADGVLPGPPARVGAGQVLKVHVLGRAGVPESASRRWR